MNRRPGHVTVTVEVGYCSFCGRPRNLRREEHQLGTLVRTIITCETCHRTLSSSIGVAQPEPDLAEQPAKIEAQATPKPEAEPVRKSVRPATRSSARAAKPAPAAPARKVTRTTKKK